MGSQVEKAPDNFLYRGIQNFIHNATIVKISLFFKNYPFILTLTPRGLNTCLPKKHSTGNYTPQHNVGKKHAFILQSWCTAPKQYHWSSAWVAAWYFNSQLSSHILILLWMKTWHTYMWYFKGFFKIFFWIILGESVVVSATISIK